MFDKNTDGVVDHKEFAKVLKAQVRRDEGSRVRNMKGKVASAGTCSLCVCVVLSYICLRYICMHRVQ